MILDEATCHLDPAAEARVERAFADGDGSRLVIAHRISSALRAQRVLVLETGQALVGEHDELLLRSALYRDLVGHWAAAPRPAATPCATDKDSAHVDGIQPPNQASRIASIGAPSLPATPGKNPGSPPFTRADLDLCHRPVCTRQRG